MCLIGLALHAHARFALVLAANRDEFHDRPTAGLDWWRADHGAPAVLAGRDLSAGGTWLGVGSQGRIGALTNVRDPLRHRVDAPSRGALVTDWLTREDDIERLWPILTRRGCNPFNLIGGDLGSGRWWWADDRQTAPLALADGVHVLSNGSLNDPWPKAVAMRLALQTALAEAATRTDVTESLLVALGDQRMPPDAALPDTGIGLERERVLAPVFIHAPSMRYGTRSSTVLIGERDGDHWRLSITERRFDALARAFEDRTVQLHGRPGAPHAAVKVSVPD